MPKPAFLDEFLSLPRLSGLALAPDGRRLVTSVDTLDPAGTAFRSALWSLDATGQEPPRRLTRSRKGESSPVFAPDGALLFVSARPDPDSLDSDDDEPPAGLWLLPPAGGEAHLLAAPPAGVAQVQVAEEAGRVVLAVEVHPGADGWEDDRAREQARKDAKVTAQLFESYPVRHWDRWLGPRERHLYAAGPPHSGTPLQPTDCIPEPARGLDETDFDVAPDGRTIVTGWWRDTGDPRERSIDLVMIDVDSGERRVLAADGAWYSQMAWAPDGSSVASVRDTIGQPDDPGEQQLVVVDIATGEMRLVGAGWDRWAHSPVWTPDGQALLVTADDHGQCPVFRVELATDEVTRLTAEGAYSDVVVSSDGTRAYALRSTPQEPPHVVAFDPVEQGQEPVRLRGPGEPVVTPGRVERVAACADDGVPVESWLVLPAGASAEQPAPLVVFIHGGPLGSWTGWHWRWNPHLLAAEGYAVLCPDPALSTGYGQDFIARGWGRWGERPYTDLMAAVDTVVQREDIDAARTAAMGGSFGGYMANWLAGHTDRFRAIITHASLWALEHFHGTTDLGVWWEREFGDPYVDTSRYEAASPHRHVDKITTPMLVIHGERDFRVPVGEALQLWTDLARHGVDAKFLYFPDEHHWVLKPQHVRVWYATALAFLDHHVRDAPWRRPELL